MLYIEKQKCPDHIQAAIDKRINTKQWRSFPEVPASSEQAHTMRKQYFDNLDKSAIREALIAEQHGLCAYCMCRVVNSGSSTTIEHMVPLSRSKAGAMSYDNWLAVCKGGTNIKTKHGEKRIICCDAKKSNMVATLTPVNREQMKWIAYYDDGTMIHNSPSPEEKRALTDEINRVYGLNGVIDSKTGHSRRDTTSGIVKKRKDAYIAMYELLMELYHQQQLTPDLIVRFRQSLLADTQWEEFVGVKLFVLDLFLETLAQTAD